MNPATWRCPGEKVAHWEAPVGEERTRQSPRRWSHRVRGRCSSGTVQIPAQGWPSRGRSVLSRAAENGKNRPPSDLSTTSLLSRKRVSTRACSSNHLPPTPERTSLTSQRMLVCYPSCLFLLFKHLNGSSSQVKFKSSVTTNVI